MKITEVYNGMKDKEIREFLSKEFHKVQHYFATGDYYEKKIERLKAEIEDLKDQITKTNNARAIFDIINNLGYQEFDISDEIEYDSNTYHSFFGTQEEYKTLLEKIEEKK